MKLPIDIAPDVPCHPDYIRKINKGQRTPRPAMFYKIKQAMQRRGINLSFDDLLAIKGPPGPQDGQSPAQGTSP